jgi:hypothetical protein
LDTIIPNSNISVTEVISSIIDKGIVTNIGFQDGQDISIGMPGFVLSSVETYLKFADAMGLTNNIPVSAYHGANNIAAAANTTSGIFLL